MEWVAGVVTAIKNAGPIVYFAALLASAALLFLPDNLITQLGLNDLRQQYRTDVGIVLIISASLLSAHVLFVI